MQASKWINLFSRTLNICSGQGLMHAQSTFKNIHFSGCWHVVNLFVAPGRLIPRHNLQIGSNPILNGKSKSTQYLIHRRKSTVLRPNLMRLYSPVQLNSTGNLIMIEEWVLGVTWTNLNLTLTFQPSRTDSKHFYSNSLSWTNRDITPAARAPLWWPCYEETLYTCPIHYITLNRGPADLQPQPSLCAIDTW